MAVDELPGSAGRLPLTVGLQCGGTWARASQYQS